MSRVLLVEDDAWLAASFARGLAPHEVVVARSPQAAVQQIDSQIPDVIVTDIMLESGNAFDVIGLLAGYVDTVNIPIIVISAITKDLSPVLESYNFFAVLDKTTLTPGELKSKVEAACKP